MFCKKIKPRLKAMLHEFDSYVDAHIDTALKITVGLKRFLSSPVADVVTAIIPGDVDVIIRTQLVNALGKVIDALTIADTCRQHKDISARLECFIEQLKLYDPHLQDAILQKLASLLAGQLHGQRLKQSLYDLYTQAKYSAAKTQTTN